MPSPDPADHMNSSPLPMRHWRIWAKWSKMGKHALAEGMTYHPLICHMLDVATVARQLWRSALPTPTRERLMRHLGLSDDDATATWIAFLTGLHDIGKASPGFQDQLSGSPAGEIIRGWMREADVGFADATWAAHGTVSARVLPSLLKQFGVGDALTTQIATLVGGHHGTFPRQLDLIHLHGRTQVGKGTWDTLRTELAVALHAGLHVPDIAPTGTLTPADAMIFAGFVTTADWIGSDEKAFHHAGQLAATPHPLALDEYVPLAEQGATEALSVVRMDPFSGTTDMRSRRTFGELFPKIVEPRHLQQVAIDLGEKLHGPALVIIEAPMGEGKTEAALYLAEVWATDHQRQGVYIALPTQATSNQMFGRVREYLGKRFAGADYVSAHLVYGDALLDESYRDMMEAGRSATRTNAQSEMAPTTGAPGVQDDASAPQASIEASIEASADVSDTATVTTLQQPLALERMGPVYDASGQESGEDGAVIAVEWFAASKRALLAPFGVGTIDQALLGILQTRHFFLRLFGLAGKTVIVDEVHAYDTYMSVLLDRLLEWLGAFGVPVVLLSATLPHARRAQLQAAYERGAGWASTSTQQLALTYPRVTWLTEGGPDGHEVRSSAIAHSVEVEWLHAGSPDSPEGLAALGEWLAARVRDGGCAAVICNTVSRAQRVYTALRHYFPEDTSDNVPTLDLFHARFPRASRMAREKRVLDCFGKGRDGTRNTERPYRAVLVATQVIEQSLDLDFDVMISDFAPVDLLLQRTGRLHRHQENDDYRPNAVTVPQLLIPRPEVRDDCPHFPSSDEFIYDGHVLLRTWLALQGRTSIQVPAQIEELVELVYTPEATCPPDVAQAVRDAWDASSHEYQRDVTHDLDAAKIQVVPSPESDLIYTGRNNSLEAPDADETAFSLTRLGAPSVRVVLLSPALMQRNLGLKGRPPSLEVARELLMHSVPIAHGAIAPALLQQEPPAPWKKSPWLRHARLVALDDAGEATIATHGKNGKPGPSYTLRLDPDLGVVITKQAKEGK